jgi:hypothetical protein
LALACRLGLLVVIGGFAMPVFALWLKVSYAAKPGVYVSQLVASVWSHAPMLELPVGTARNTTLVAAVMLSSTFLLNYFLSGAVGG